MTASPNTLQEKDFRLEQFVGSRIGALQHAYLHDDPDAVAAMAVLRRGVGAPQGLRPEIWALILNAKWPEKEKWPEVLADPATYTRAERDGAPTAWEQAAYDALTLHAWHQRSRDEPMHRPRARFGAAISTLGKRSDSEETVRKRFHALGTATHHDARLVHLRTLVSLLRDYRIPIDYGRLAGDLRRLGNPAIAERTLLQWSRDYHHNDTATTESMNDLETATITGEDQ
ncbi:type I-E CRISPR-associated protein Cse2/CasB [Nocardia terpenica]|uniref:type I-E CRISPR-associated protein Cse2/CasB n=1 Tax=Nocardia terpenica TaxID=455432 RepID=UPI002FE28F19